jgi:type VI secretion system lysozyme-like protein
MEPDDERYLVTGAPRLSKGQPAPLFERLVGERLVGHQPSAGEPLRSYETGEAAESVRREVERLLNTRRPPLPTSTLGATVIQYGVPDFSHLATANTMDLVALSRALSQAIQSFEPRLTNVRVELQPDPKHPSAALGCLYASLRIRMVSEPVCFPLQLGRNGAASIAEAAEK